MTARATRPFLPAAYRRAAGVLLTIIVLCVQGTAFANGRFPTGDQLVIAPSDDNTLILRATVGLLVSHDRGAHWGWVCEKAVGFDGEEDPSIAITGSSAVLVALYEGLAVSPDRACSWGFAGALSGRVAIDVAVRPDNPHKAVALDWIESTDDAGLITFENRIHATEDDGVHWTSLRAGPLDPTAFLQTIELAASDEDRIYITGAHGIYQPTDEILFVSRDGGKTFDPRVLPVNTKLETQSFVAAVDPSNADRVYIRTWPVSRLLVSNDGGTTFHSPLSFAGEMRGFSLSADGQTIYVGGPSDGLWVGDAATLTFRRVSDVSIRCLASRGDALYACSDDPAFVVGVSHDGGQSFVPTLRFEAVEGALACPASTSTASCATDFPDVCASLGACPDAGADVSIDASVAASVPPPAGGDGCAIVPGSTSRSRSTPTLSSVCAGAALFLAASVALLRRQRAS